MDLATPVRAVDFIPALVVGHILVLAAVRTLAQVVEHTQVPVAVRTLALAGELIPGRVVERIQGRAVVHILDQAAVPMLALEDLVTTAQVVEILINGIVHPPIVNNSGESCLSERS